MAIRKWGTEFLVNTTTTGSQSGSAVTALDDGGFAIAWRDAGPVESLVHWQRFDASGVKAGLEVTTDTFAGGHQSDPTLAGLPSGKVWVAQSDFDTETGLYHNVIGAVFGDNGSVLEYRDGGYGAISSVAYSAGAMASLGNAGSVIAFTRAEYGAGGAISDYDAVMRGYNTAGVQTFTISLVMPDDNITLVYPPDPQIAANPSGTRFVVSCRANFTQIWNSVYDASGSGLSSFSANPADSVESEASVAWLDDSRIATVWKINNPETQFGGDGYGSAIKLIIADYNGNYLSSETLVNTTTAGNQSDPVIAVLNDGSFVVAWVDGSSSFPDTSGGSIRLQAFNTLGQKTGQEYTVNTTLTGSQSDVAIAALADGRVVVTWTDPSATGSDSSGDAVRAQIVDPRDGIISGSNSTTTGDIMYGNDASNDEMNGYAGNDSLYGLAGADILMGGAGDDNLSGGRGDDTSYGGANNDRIYGDLGDDEQYGELGNDLIYSGRGADLMDGGAGSDTAYYSAETVGAVINLLNQTLNAGSADGDTLAGIETIFGSLTAADNISGDNLGNTLLGNGGVDTLNGNGGNDILRGGAGADILNGGTGADKFQFITVADLGDTIINFEAVDDFQFARAGFGNLAGANVAAFNFLSVLSGHAAITIDHRFIFDQATDQLWYDADGSTATIAAVMVADLSNNINISNTDLLLF